MSLFDEHALRQLFAEELRRVVREELPAIVRKAMQEAGGVAGDRADSLAQADYLTAEQAAAIAGVKPETVRGWVRRGDLPSHHAGRLLRLRRDELTDFLDRRLGPATVAQDDLSHARKLVRLACAPRRSKE